VQKVLIVDDSEAIRLLLQARLSAEPIELHCADSGASGLRLSGEILPDLILLDLELPDIDGLEVCRRLKANPRTQSIPIVFISGTTDTARKIEGLEMGAADYITKPFDAAELRARIRVSLRAKYLLDLLARKAMIDGLTGLWNRTYFETRLTAETSLARRNAQPLACVMIDLDHFKQINDRYGHPFGDDVLRGVAQLMNEACRSEDLVCRYGGEEFVVLAPNTTAGAAMEVAERIRTAVAACSWTHHESLVQVTCSLGVADLQQSSLNGILEFSDAALYQAKQAGRNRVALYAPEPATPRVSA
jgi:two-component system cell cycle response regulator